MIRKGLIAVISVVAFATEMTLAWSVDRGQMGMQAQNERVIR